MIDDRELTRAIDRWLDLGPTEMPDRVVDVVAARIAMQRQRRAWRLLDRRPSVTTSTRMLVFAAALVAALVGGAALLGVGAPTPSLTPATTPSPSSSEAGSPSPPESSPVGAGALCSISDPACLGELEAGIHETADLVTPLRYTVPEGWTRDFQVAGALNIRPTGQDPAIFVWPDPVAAEQRRCSAGVESGVGRTIEDHVAWLTTHPGLITTEPTPISIGGLDGVTLDLRKEPEYSGGCLDRVSLWVHDGDLADEFWWDVGDDARLRLHFLRTPSGRTILIDIEAAGQAAFESFLNEATPVVASMEFLAPFESARYGYTVAYPRGWEIRPATADWGPTTVPDVATDGLDRFVSPGFLVNDPMGRFFGVASQAIPLTETAESWTQELEDRLRAMAAEDCIGSEPDWRSAVVAGRNARIATLDCTTSGDVTFALMSVVFTVGDRGWIVTGDRDPVEVTMDSLVVPAGD